jgi:hypothetical protein
MTTGSVRWRSSTIGSEASECCLDALDIIPRRPAQGTHGLPGRRGLQPCLGSSEFLVAPGKGRDLHQLIAGETEKALHQHELEKLAGNQRRNTAHELAAAARYAATGLTGSRMITGTENNASEG